MKKQKGYTLVELIIGVAFICILALIGFGGYVVSKFW